MSKVMVVTVGTSLFHSASWIADEGMELEIPRYSGWMRPDLLASPDRRLSDVRSAVIREKLRERLTAESDNLRRWGQRLPADLVAGHPARTTRMRYCAELSTILALADEGSDGAGDAGQDAPGDLAEFLRSYEEIRLVHDPDTYTRESPNLTMVVAAHLATYLDTIARRRVASPWPWRGMSAGEPRILLDSLRRLREQLEGDLGRDRREMDLVVSGGYKLYGILLARLSSPRVRLLYIHEDGNKLVIYSDGEARIEEWNTRPTTRPGPD